MDPSQSSTSNEPSSKAAVEIKAKAEMPKVTEQNPALRAMGLPRLKMKLPSRNWMIFLTVTGTITSLIVYDRREKKKAQLKWCKLVSHLADEPMNPKAMPRKLNVFLSAPPADGLRSAREHFSEYVKPILVAAALDWDVVEGRKEDDVRSKFAESIRKRRRKTEQPSKSGEESVDILDEVRKAQGIQGWDGIRGDIVIGRHTWKEYLRGLHEGWLGPLDPPPSNSETKIEATEASNAEDKQSPQAVPDTEPPSDAKKSVVQTPESLKLEYETGAPGSSIPAIFDPSITIPHFHILGFLNTPTRIYRFFTRRYMADEIGRETAAVVLAHSRPYSQLAYSSLESVGADGSSSKSSTELAPDESYVNGNQEQQEELASEEQNWHKSVRKRKEDEVERVWLDDIVLDPRISARMRKFFLPADQGQKAEEGVASIKSFNTE